MSPEECNDKLEQLIIDENEFVTYKLLSKELKIHVNEAKKYLYDYLTVQNSKEEVRLFAHYFVSGTILKDGTQVRKCVIVTEDNLEKVKKEFKEVTSCHIYSLNKRGCSDKTALYNCQSWCKKWANEHREYAAIKHPNILFQTPVIKKIAKTEVSKIETKTVASKVPPTKPDKKEAGSSFFKTNTKASENNSTASTSKESTSKVSQKNNDNEIAESSNSSNTESKDQKKSTLSNLWQKLEDKTKNGKSENSKPETKGKKGANKPVAKNNIMSMFSKQAEKNSANPVKKGNDSSSSSVHVSPTSDKESKKVTPKEEKPTVKVHSPKKEKTVAKVPSPKKNKGKKSQRKAKRVTKPNSDEESDEDIKPKKKKHRRICTMDDSDSESDTEEAQDRAQRSILSTNGAEEETPMHVSDEEPIPPTPPVVSAKGKKKVWKTVQKTFQDDDGFLVSKKEKVLVSGSDSEENPLPTKKSPLKSENKQNTLTYRKQASLTSFFNKR